MPNHRINTGCGWQCCAPINRSGPRLCGHAVGLFCISEPSPKRINISSWALLHHSAVEAKPSWWQSTWNKSVLAGIKHKSKAAKQHLRAGNSSSSGSTSNQNKQNHLRCNFMLCNGKGKPKARSTAATAIKPEGSCSADHVPSSADAASQKQMCMSDGVSIFHIITVYSSAPSLATC